MQDIIVAIDGYSGCGKSSTAKAVAKALGYTYLDSGAMYRAATLYFIRHKIDLQNTASVQLALDDIDIHFYRNKDTLKNETYLNGENVEEEIRKMEVSENVSSISAVPEVRKKMVSQQRKLGNKKGVVMDGRDIGSHVFPEAELKIFMKADLLVRAERRRKELEEKGEMVSLEEIKHNLAERDRIDTSRAQSPLVKVDSAVEIDTTYLSFSEQVDKILEIAREQLKK